MQEAAERQQRQANKENESGAVTVDDDSSSDTSSYWDMPTDHEQALSWVIENNQPQKKISCHDHPRRPLNHHHHAAPIDMDVNAYWNNDSGNNHNQNDDGDYWNDPSHSHYYPVKGSANQNMTITKSVIHYGDASIDLDTMMIMSYWDEAAPTIDDAATAYWIDTATSHDKARLLGLADGVLLF